MARACQSGFKSKNGLLAVDLESLDGPLEVLELGEKFNKIYTAVHRTIKEVQDQDQIKI